MLSRLRSPKLTLAVLVLLAATAIMGTPWPVEKAEALLAERFGSQVLPPARFFGLVDTYRSPLFVALLVLLTINITLCTWHRFSRHRKMRGKEDRRQGHGLRVALDVVMHLSVIIILVGGAAKGLFATVATGHLFLETETDTVYDWGAEADVPLGFALLLRERVDDYYPLQVRVGIRDTASGEKVALLELKEGHETVLPGEDLLLSVGDHDIDGQWIVVRVKAGGRSRKFRLETVPGGRTSAAFGEYGLTLVGWRRDLRSVRGRVAVLDGGEEVKEQWIEPNGRLGYEGTSIFLTAWGEDEYRNPYLGIQVTRDPGAFPFWIGATLLGVSLPLFVLVRSRRRGREGRDA